MLQLPVLSAPGIAMYAPEADAVLIILALQYHWTLLNSDVYNLLLADAGGG